MVSKRIEARPCTTSVGASFTIDEKMQTGTPGEGKNPEFLIFLWIFHNARGIPHGMATG